MKKLSRRKLVLSLAAVPVWSKPVIQSVILPAHAGTSSPVTLPPLPPGDLCTDSNGEIEFFMSEDTGGGGFRNAIQATVLISPSVPEEDLTCDVSPPPPIIVGDNVIRVDTGQGCEGQPEVEVAYRIYENDNPSNVIEGTANITASFTRPNQYSFLIINADLFPGAPDTMTALGIRVLDDDGNIDFAFDACSAVVTCGGNCG